MHFSFEAEERIETLKIMALGLLVALVLNIPFFNQVYDKGWRWADGFPFGWLHMSLVYMTVFFHELGHAIAFWFYGYIALPGFDFNHGGGMTYTMTGQLLVLHAVLYALLAYGFFYFKDQPWLKWSCVALGIFHFATAHTAFHDVFCTFSGHLGQVLIAAFLLMRAWFNMAPRGVFERILNGAFGFGMSLQILFEGWALTHLEFYRQFYYEQKGRHGFGDLDRVADATGFEFSTVVIFLMILGGVAIALPAFAWLRTTTSGAQSGP